MNQKYKKAISISYVLRSTWVIIPLVAIVYLMLAKLSQLVKIPPGEISPVFAASGIALAAVLLFRWPALIGVFLGSFMTNATAFPLKPVLLFIGFGAAAGAGISAYLVRRFCKDGNYLSSGRNVIILLFFGAIIGCIISPAIGVLSLSISGNIPWEYFYSSFLTWWVGDTSGVIVIVPLILAWNLKTNYRKKLLLVIEAILLMFATILLCYWVFLNGLRLDYFLSLLLVYAAFRFDIRLVSTLALLIAIFATIGTSMGTGLYAGNSANITLIHLISFLCVSIISALILSGIMSERKLALQEIERYQNNLEKLVAERTNDLEAANEELKSTNEKLNEKNQIIFDQNTELKATMLRLQETQSILIQADKMASLGVLTAGVAHEINNPLNFIMGSYVELDNYFKETEVNDTRIPILLNGIKIGVDRASEIVKGLNQFSRNNEKIIEDCYIHSIINNCLVMMNNQFKERIVVNKNFCTEEIKIAGNVGKLHQVFINILSNSIQAIDQNGVISINTSKLEQNIIIEIADTGCGISKENISKIVEPFFTTKDPGKGTGLGLSISYNIIRELKGKIEFCSEPNKGTTVKIILPDQ